MVTFGGQNDPIFGPFLDPKMQLFKPKMGPKMGPKNDPFLGHFGVKNDPKMGHFWDPFLDTFRRQNGRFGVPKMTQK